MTLQTIWWQDGLLAKLPETFHHMVRTQHTSVDHGILSIHHYPIQEKDLKVYDLLKHGFLFEELHIPVLLQYIKYLLVTYNDCAYCY